MYANYGRYQDLSYLRDELKMNLTGRLLLIRYGSSFRGDKILNAERFGAGGVILYRQLSHPFELNSPISFSFC